MARIRGTNLEGANLDTHSPTLSAPLALPRIRSAPNADIPRPPPVWRAARIGRLEFLHHPRAGAYARAHDNHDVPRGTHEPT